MLAIIILYCIECRSMGSIQRLTKHVSTPLSLSLSLSLPPLPCHVQLAYFFEPRFGDPEKELNFRKERWYNTKRNATFGCCFMILNWILLVALLNTIGVWQKVLYYGVLTLFVWPVPVMIAFDLPRKWPNFYSFWTITAVMLPAFLGSEFFFDLDS